MTICAFATVGPAQGVKQSPFGVVLTPANYPFNTVDDGMQAWREALAVCGKVSHIVHWVEGEAAFTANADLMRVAGRFGMPTFIQFSPFSIGQLLPPAGVTSATVASFSDPAVKARYLADVVRLASLRPTYLNLAAEVDLVHYFVRPEWEHFKPAYREAYDLVKQISPDTKVGASFHLDAFFGDQEYGLPDDLGPHEFVGFTSYPAWAVYEGYFASVADFPASYYSRIRAVLPNKTIVMAEISWPSAGKGNPTDQATFLSRLPELLRDVQPEVIIWPMLNDAPVFNLSILTDYQKQLLAGAGIDPVPLFAELNSMGLLGPQGAPKPAWHTALTTDFNQ